MGQISVKTYAPNGSLLNDNQQDDHIDTAIASLDTGMFDEITHELHTQGNQGRPTRAKIVAISSGKTIR